MDEDFEVIDMAKCLMQLAESGKKKKQRYECRTCRKSFSSFQALGGHTTSHSHHPKSAQEHKKRRFSDQVKDDSAKMSYKSRSFKCSMCESVFSSGQALGGHMRKHRPLADNCAGFSTEMISLDLNFPPLEEGEDHGEQF